MKKYFLTLLSLLPLIGMAEFINLDLCDKSILVTDVNSHFEEWFGLASHSFIVYNDELDEIGMRHIAYQQYDGEIKIENCILIVHSKNGIVISINGDIMMPAQRPVSVMKMPKREALSKASIETDTTNVEITYIHKRIGEEERYYKVYKVESPQETKYIDIETGEIVEVISKTNFSTRCSGSTKYSGTKDFDCEISNNKYVLKDDTRNIRAYLTQMDFTTLNYGTKYNFTSENKNWEGNYITSVTVNALHNNWWSSIGDQYADLYIAIYDDNDVLLYYSDYKSDIGQERSLPVIFRISSMIRVPPSANYKIKIFDYDAFGDNDLGATGTLSSNSLGTHSWGNFSSNAEFSCEITAYHPALDLFWGLGVVYDYYQSVFNRKSFDNKGAETKAFLHRVATYDGIKDEEGKDALETIDGNNQYENAYATGDANDVTSAYLHFGLGDEFFNTRVGLNTISHEFTHLICKYRSLGDLQYKGESGALNESMADMMALSIEHYANPTTFNWLYGEDHMIFWNCTRNFIDPSDAYPPQPVYYGGERWVDPSSKDDNGGVHYNSGVSNHWFYLLCEGGKGTNEAGNYYEVKGIGIDKAQRIIFRALVQYIPRQPTFLQTRTLMLQASADLYGKNSAEYIAVANAWYAVGVGEKYKEEFTLTPGKYAIVASRAKDTDKNWFYMSATKDGTKERFQAINSEKTDINAINLKDLPDAYIWELVADGSKWKLKNGSQYISWTSNNTAKLDATGKSLTFDIAENQVEAYFNDGTADRYLSLNATTGNNFFAFYGNKGQITYLYFLPIEEDKPTPPTPSNNEYYIVAKRSTGNYYFFTPDKVSGKDRLIAVDAGTSIRSKVDTVNTSSAYLWTLEDSGSGKLLKNHNGSYLTCTEAKTAAMASTGKVLKVTNNTDGTTTFSYAADASTTHYLSLANAGSDYFVFYANTNQVTHLLLLPKGNGAATSIEDVVETPKPKKIMRDGQILINRDGVLYNMMGQKVQ